MKLLYHASLAEAWPRFQQSLPWTLMTFAVAYVVAALADDARFPPSRMSCFFILL